MLDKTSNKILEYFKAPDTMLMLFGEWPNSLGDEDIGKESVKYLVDRGYLEYVSDINGNNLAIKLSHLGIHRGEFKKLSILDYAKENWIAIIALIISIISFIRTF